MCTITRPEEPSDCLRAGTTKCILKTDAPDKIFEAIRDIHRSGSPMSAEIVQMVVRSFPNKKQIPSCRTVSQRASRKYCMRWLRAFPTKRLLIIDNQ